MDSAPALNPARADARPGAGARSLGIARLALRLVAVPPAMLSYYLRWGALMWLVRAGTDAAAAGRRWDRLQRLWVASEHEAAMGRVDYWAIRLLRKGAPLRLRPFLLAPLRMLTRAREAVRFRGPGLQRESGIPLRVQLVDLWLLQLRLPATFSMEPELYYDQRLYQPERRAGGRYLFSRFQQNVLVPAVNRRRCLGKGEFAETCAAAGLPHARTIAVIEAGGAVRWVDGGGTLPPEDLFSKPEGGEGGHGAQRWLYQPDGRYRAESGGLLDAEAVLDALRAEAGKAAVVVQSRLRNHPAVEEQFGATLATIRCVTELLPDGRVEPVAAMHRSASGDSPVDSYSQGGVCCAIDLETGALRRPTVRHVADGNEAAMPLAADVHPLTGRPITGFRLPYWSETLALLARAHPAFSRYPLLGWDVAICPGGPVLVEANTAWSADGLQDVHQRGLGTALPYVERLLDRVAASPAANQGYPNPRDAQRVVDQRK